MHYILFYDYVEDFVAKRAPLRAAHFELARKSYDRGEMVLAGAYAEPDHGAILVFRSEAGAKYFSPRPIPTSQTAWSPNGKSKNG